LTPLTARRQLCTDTQFPEVASKQTVWNTSAYFAQTIALEPGLRNLRAKFVPRRGAKLAKPVLVFPRPNKAALRRKVFHLRVYGIAVRCHADILHEFGASYEIRFSPAKLFTRLRIPLASQRPQLAFAAQETLPRRTIQPRPQFSRVGRFCGSFPRHGLQGALRLHAEHRPGAIGSHT
jgi:hypothetical protein